MGGRLHSDAWMHVPSHSNCSACIAGNSPTSSVLVTLNTSRDCRYTSVGGSSPATARDSAAQWGEQEDNEGHSQGLSATLTR